jgi:tetratricopeptide (TPR) repeat protein
MEMRFRVGLGWAVASLLGCLLTFAIISRAGAAGVNITRAQAYVASPGNEDLIVEIRRADGGSLPGTAKIRLTTRQAAQAELTAAPQQRHRARFTNVPLGPIHLQVLADGFVPADLRLLLDHAGREMRVTIYLRTEGASGPGGEAWLPALSPSASSSYAKILDSLRKGNLKESHQRYAKLGKSSYGHPSVQYLAGVVDYKSNEPGMALFHFSLASYLNPDSDDSALALGELLYHTGIYSDAYQVFHGLAQRHPDQWEPAWEAASAAFRSARYPEARESAQAATVCDAKHALKAQVLLALTDALLKKWNEAHEAATAYLSQGSDPELAATAKDLLAAVGAPDASGDTRRHALPPERADVALFSAADFDPRLPPRLWAPPDVDDATPALVEGAASCNSAEVLKRAGERVQVRFQELRQIAATEHIEQAVLDATGRIMPLKHFTVDYLADVHPMPNDTYAVDEYQGGILPEPSDTSPPVAHGLAALELVFYPPMQSDFVFKCEGLTQWNAHPAWSIYFTQRKDVPARLHAYEASGTFYPAYVRGRGIVDQASGELLHMETDLEDPIPQVRLEEEHLVVDYTPMNFKSVALPIFLPAYAELFVHYRGHLYRVRHSFEKYLRFAVDTRQDIRRPKDVPPEPEPEPKSEQKPSAEPQGQKGPETSPASRPRPAP